MLDAVEGVPAPSPIGGVSQRAPKEVLHARCSPTKFVEDFRRGLLAKGIPCPHLGHAVALLPCTGDKTVFDQVKTNFTDRAAFTAGLRQECREAIDGFDLLAPPKGILSHEHQSGILRRMLRFAYRDLFDVIRCMNAYASGLWVDEERDDELSRGEQAFAAAVRSFEESDESAASLVARVLSDDRQAKLAEVYQTHLNVTYAAWVALQILQPPLPPRAAAK
jgi:hypothetical protein